MIFQLCGKNIFFNLEQSNATEHLFVVPLVSIDLSSCSSYRYVPGSSHVCCNCGPWCGWLGTHWAPERSMTPRMRSDRGHRHFPLLIQTSTPFAKTDQHASTSHNALLQQNDPQGRQLPITTSAGSAASGHRAVDVRRPLRGTPALHIGSSLCIHGG